MGPNSKGIKRLQAPSWGVTDWHQLPEGKSALDVSDYKNKVLFLYFFQSWCPGCHRSGFPTLQKVQQAFRDDKDVGIVAVQTAIEGFEYNTPLASRMCAQKYGLTIPIGHSGGPKEPSKLLSKYRARDVPWTVIIDHEGMIRYIGSNMNSLEAIKMINFLKEKRVVDRDGNGILEDQESVSKRPSRQRSRRSTGSSKRGSKEANGMQLPSRRPTRGSKGVNDLQLSDGEEKPAKPKWFKVLNVARTR